MTPGSGAARAALVVCCFSAIAALQTRNAANGTCDGRLRARSRELLAGGSFDALERNPCFDPTDLQQIRAGFADPADAVEFLGYSAPAKPLQFFANKTVSGSSEAFSCPFGRKTLLPKVLYIGMGHSGSTSLADQMNRHPGLSYGDMKEHRFFASVPLTKVMSFEDYTDQFQVPCNVQVTFDASPGDIRLGLPREHAEHFKFHLPGVGALEKVKELLGEDLKFIAMFRDPMEFIRSKAHDIPGTPTEGLEKLTEVCYSKLLENWLKVFPRESFLFLKSEDYFRDPQGTLDEIFNFVGLPHMRLRKTQLVASGRRRDTHQWDVFNNETVRRNFYGSKQILACRARLETQTGLSFDWGSDLGF